MEKSNKEEFEQELKDLFGTFSEKNEKYEIVLKHDNYNNFQRTVRKYGMLYCVCQSEGELLNRESR